MCQSLLLGFAVYFVAHKIVINKSVEISLNVLQNSVEFVTKILNRYILG